MKVAIIGGGIFGSISSYFLQNDQHEVSLFEKSGSILSGASNRNQNRLHLGFHYPRDLETAVQSRIGYLNFVQYFPEACNLMFPCFYGLSSFSTKTTFSSYLRFMEESNLEYEILPKNVINEYGFDTTKISHLWKCSEGVVDNKILRDLIMEKLVSSGVKIYLEDEVLKVHESSGLWRLTSQKTEGLYDVVIKATYGLDNIESDEFVKNISNSIFQSTLVIDAKLPIEKMGLTIVDGDFLTILPKGFSGNSLIYAPGPSVMKQSEYLQEVVEFNSSLRNINLFSDNLMKRFNLYFPEVRVNQIDNLLVTIRNIEKNSQQTDKRVSKIDVLATNYYSIWSGKIDHSIEIAKNFVDLLRI